MILFFSKERKDRERDVGRDTEKERDWFSLCRYQRESQYRIAPLCILRDKSIYRFFLKDRLREHLSNYKSSRWSDLLFSIHSIVIRYEIPDFKYVMLVFPPIIILFDREDSNLYAENHSLW